MKYRNSNDNDKDKTHQKTANELKLGNLQEPKWYKILMTMPEQEIIIYNLYVSVGISVCTYMQSSQARAKLRTELKWRNKIKWEETLRNAQKADANNLWKKKMEVLQNGLKWIEMRYKGTKFSCGHEGSQGVRGAHLLGILRCDVWWK